MNIVTFQDLPIGARLKRLTCDSVAVYTKTDNEYRIDESSAYPIPNASSSKFGFTAFALDDVVMSLTDVEVVKAGDLEDIYRIGKDLQSNAALIHKGEFYVKVKVLKPQLPTESI